MNAIQRPGPILTLTASEKSEFARTILHETYDLPAMGRIETSLALKSIEQELDELLALNEPATLKRRYEWLAQPDTNEASFQESLYAIGPAEIADSTNANVFCPGTIGAQRKFLAGIRHAGGDRELPFVHVTAGFALSEPADLKALGAFIENQFAVFKPRYMACWLNPASRLAQELEKLAQPARRYLFGRTQELLQMPKPAAYEKLELELVSDSDYFNLYQDEYRQFHQAKPELKNWVTMNDRDELEESRREGLLFRAYVGGEWAGLIGGNSVPLLGMSGLYMSELLIASEFKGQSLAAALQRKFIEAVGHKYEVVWGTIDARNLPSTKTALRVGRRPVRAEYFIPLRHFV